MCAAVSAVRRGLCVVLLKVSTSTSPLAAAALATLRSSAKALLSMSMSITSRTEEGSGSSAGDMLDGMPRASNRCSGGLAAAVSRTAESPPAPALKVTMPSCTVKASWFRRSSVERPGML